MQAGVQLWEQRKREYDERAEKREREYDERMAKRARESSVDRARVDRQDREDRERAERSGFRKSVKAAARAKPPLKQGEHRVPKKVAQHEERQGHAPRDPSNVALAVPPDPGEPTGEPTPSVPSGLTVSVPPDPGDPEGEPSPAPDHTPANPMAIGASLNFDGTAVPQSEQRLFLKNTLCPAGSTIHRGDAALGGHVSRAKEDTEDLKKMCRDESSSSSNSSSSSSGTTSSSSNSSSSTSTQSEEEEVATKEARTTAPLMTGDTRHTQAATLLDSLMPYNRRTLTNRISVKMQLARHGFRLVEDRRTARMA
jgi:hypothetical protein